MKAEPCMSPWWGCAPCSTPEKALGKQRERGMAGAQKPSQPEQWVQERDPCYSQPFPVEHCEPGSRTTSKSKCLECFSWCLDVLCPRLGAGALPMS